MAFKTWLGITLDELAEGLVTKFGLTGSGVVDLTCKFAGMWPTFQEDFRRFWETGVADSSYEIEGYSVNSLIEKRKMKPTGAFATMVWLDQEPEKAVAALKRSYDGVISGIVPPKPELPYKTWLGTTLDETADGLMERLGVSARSIPSIVEQIFNMSRTFRPDFEKYWQTGVLQSDIEIEGWNAQKLIEHFGFKPIGAFTSLMWLEREPKEAAAALKRGIK